MDMFFRSSGYDLYGLSRVLTGFLPLAIIVIIALIVIAVSKGKRGSSSNLILEEFNFYESADEFLEIKGRASGFWSWLLSLFNKASITTFVCDKQVIIYEASKIKHNIPLANVTCVKSGMLNSSIILLVLGIIFIIAGLISSDTPAILITGLVVGIIFIIVYVQNRKTMYFGICVCENKPLITISMKRGIINSIDDEKFEMAVKTFNEVVLTNIKAK
jgi:hypothetical protein